jgi:hypothetical protein
MHAGLGIVWVCVSASTVERNYDIAPRYFPREIRCAIEDPNDRDTPLRLVPHRAMDLLREYRPELISQVGLRYAVHEAVDIAATLSDGQKVLHAGGEGGASRPSVEARHGLSELTITEMRELEAEPGSSPGINVDEPFEWLAYGAGAVVGRELPQDSVDPNLPAFGALMLRRHRALCIGYDENAGQRPQEPEVPTLVVWRGPGRDRKRHKWI